MRRLAAVAAALVAAPQAQAAAGTRSPAATFVPVAHDRSR